MLKKSLLIIASILFVTVSFAGAASISKTQPMSSDQKEYQASLAYKYGALSTQDIEDYITIGKDLEKAFKSKDKLEVAKVMQQVGWKVEKGLYVDIRITHGYWLLTEPERYSVWLSDREVPSIIIPTKDELKLIDKYRTKLSRILD